MKNVNSKALYALVAFLIFSTNAFAAPECGNDALVKKAVHNLPGSGYWMQVAGDCRITYTSVGGVYSKMYNLCERKAEDITPYIDAYGLPEGDIYLHPENGISFYKMSGVKANGQNNQPFYSDPQNFGNYQSIGTLPGSTPDKRKIRIAMGNAGGTFRDYIIEKKGADDFSVKPIQDDVIEACKNLDSGGIDTEIPILSKDGQMIAGRQLDSRKTEIFKIDTASGDCKSIAKIPTETSKVTFSFDNKSVYYVMRDPNTMKGRLMKMDISSNKVTTISGPDEDVLYVTTKKDGTLFYSRVGSAGGSAGFGDVVTSDLVEVGPNSFPTGGDAKTYEALGMMWAKACGKSLDLDYAFAVGQRLDRAVCTSIAKDENMSSLDQEHKVSLDKLKSACGSNAVSGGSSRSTGTQ
ncbi:hypothetical protein [Bdellovibrio sp. HCB337]|uniref:hypothetical protein n=1 Tax=Bdellovibrio sp. HCB337 TaxID=3394358 RepID=UPI0039A719C2